MSRIGVLDQPFLRFMGRNVLHRFGHSFFADGSRCPERHSLFPFCAVDEPMAALGEASLRIVLEAVTDAAGNGADLA